MLRRNKKRIPDGFFCTDGYPISILPLLLSANLIEFSNDEQAAMNTEGKVGWEEIVDSCLDGKFDVQELNEVAALGYKCINRMPRKRPSMRDIVQVLARILKLRHNRRHPHHRKSLSAITDEATIDVDQPETKTPIMDHRRDESVDSTADCEV